LADFGAGLEAFQCAFCGGWGHYASKCATKKTVDRACDNNPAWKVVWGTYKSIKKFYGAKARADNTFLQVDHDYNEEEEEEEEEVDKDDGEEKKEDKREKKKPQSKLQPPTKIFNITREKEDTEMADDEY